MTASRATIDADRPETSLSPAEIIRQSFVLAAQAQASGNLAEAEQLFRAILAAEPTHADALHGLGTLAHQLGRSDVAADLIGKAIAQRNEPIFHNNLGIALLELGRSHEAIAAHYRALELKSAYPEAYNAIGNAQVAIGSLDEAIASYERAIALKPAYAAAHANLGNAFKSRGQLAAAEDAFAQALLLDPDCAEAHNNLGSVFREQGRLDEAIASFRRALDCRPGYADAYNNLGNIHALREDHREALESFKLALTYQPDFPEALSGYGFALNALGRTAEAASAWQKAIEIDPDCFEAHCFIGKELSKAYLPDECIAAFERALRIKPDYAEAHNNIGTAHLAEGCPERAVEAFDRTIALAPHWPLARSNRLLAMNYIPSLTVAELLAEARTFGALFDLPSPAAPVVGADPERRLRIGYVSGDLIYHPVGFYFAPALAAHNPDAVETFCYSNNNKSDELTERMRASSNHWRDICDLTDFGAAQLIERDGIDILVDLSGHTDKNRLPLFGLKPAPIQVSWIGYFGTTGMTTIDYVLLDPVSAPPGAEAGYSECVVRLPHGRFCYEAPDYAPDVVDPPSASRGYITFGSFNNVAKITSEVIALWAEILRANPDSRLVLKWMSLRDKAVRGRLREAFLTEGIEKSRVQLRVPSTHAGALEQYGDIDIALDPFPFCGALTTCDSLWMGVPVITLPGERLASRQTLSFLEAMGMSEGLVANSPEHYVALATALANDPARLRELRRKLRPTMANAPFCNGATFTAGLEASYREMWRRHCDGLAPVAFDIDENGARREPKQLRVRP